MSRQITPLNQLRNEISRIDEDILALIAKRLDLSKKVGIYKQEQQLPIKDYNVEKQVIDKARRRAAELAIYPELAESIAKTLIHYSVLKQDELHRTMAAQNSNGKSILIVGGLGLMGGWLAHFFESLGYHIVLNDVKNPDKQHDLFNFEPDLAKGCREADVIILATPLAQTATILRQVVDLRPKGLMIEICSLKTPLKTALQYAKDAGTRVASIHPMFGPDAEILAGRNIVLCETGDEASLRIVEEMLQTTSANLIRMPLDKHDCLMSYVLGAAHLSNLIYGGVIADSGIELAEHAQVGGTTFKNQIMVTAAVVRENQDLYYEIQAANAFTPKILEDLSSILAKYKQSILDQDRTAFKVMMEKARQYFDKMP